MHRILSSVIALGALHGCVQLLGGDEEPRFPPAEPAVDGSTNEDAEPPDSSPTNDDDGGDRDAGSSPDRTGAWCKAQPASTGCWDFDGADGAFAGWRTTAFGMGKAEASDASPPLAFVASVNAGSPDSYLRETFALAQQPQHIGVELQIRDTQCPALEASKYTILAALDFPPPAGVNVGGYVRLLATPSGYSGQVCNDNGCTNSQLGAASGGWSSAAFDVDRGSQTVSIRVGTAVKTWPVTTRISAATSVMLKVGIESPDALGPPPACGAKYDNVRLSIQP